MHLDQAAVPSAPVSEGLVEIGYSLEASLLSLEQHLCVSLGRELSVGTSQKRELLLVACMLQEHSGRPLLPPRCPYTQEKLGCVCSEKCTVTWPSEPSFHLEK